MRAMVLVLLATSALVVHVDGTSRPVERDGAAWFSVMGDLGQPESKTLGEAERGAPSKHTNNLVRPGMVITLRGAGGRFCSTEAGVTKCEKQVAGDWERFLVIPMGDGLVALKALASGEQCATEGALVECTPQHANELQKLNVTTVGPKTITIAAAGQFCTTSADNCTSDSCVKCSTTAEESAEKFQVNCVRSCQKRKNRKDWGFVPKGFKDMTSQFARQLAGYKLEVEDKSYADQLHRTLVGPEHPAVIQLVTRSSSSSPKKQGMWPVDGGVDGLSTVFCCSDAAREGERNRTCTGHMKIGSGPSHKENLAQWPPHMRERKEKEMLRGTCDGQKLREVSIAKIGYPAVNDGEGGDIGDISENTGAQVGDLHTSGPWAGWSKNFTIDGSLGVYSNGKKRKCKLNVAVAMHVCPGGETQNCKLCDPDYVQSDIKIRLHPETLAVGADWACANWFTMAQTQIHAKAAAWRARYGVAAVQACRSQMVDMQGGGGNSKEIGESQHAAASHTNKAVKGHSSGPPLNSTHLGIVNHDGFPFCPKDQCSACSGNVEWTELKGIHLQNDTKCKGAYSPGGLDMAMLTSTKHHAVDSGLYGHHWMDTELANLVGIKPVQCKAGAPLPKVDLCAGLTNKKPDTWCGVQASMNKCILDHVGGKWARCKLACCKTNPNKYGKKQAEGIKEYDPTGPCMQFTREVFKEAYGPEGEHKAINRPRPLNYLITPGTECAYPKAQCSNALVHSEEKPVYWPWAKHGPKIWNNKPAALGPKSNWREWAVNGTGANEKCMMKVAVASKTCAGRGSIVKSVKESQCIGWPWLQSSKWERGCPKPGMENWNPNIKLGGEKDKPNNDFNSPDFEPGCISEYCDDSTDRCPFGRVITELQTAFGGGGAECLEWFVKAQAAMNIKYSFARLGAIFAATRSCFAWYEAGGPAYNNNCPAAVDGAIHRRRVSTPKWQKCVSAGDTSLTKCQKYPGGWNPSYCVGGSHGCTNIRKGALAGCNFHPVQSDNHLGKWSCPDPIPKVASPKACPGGGFHDPNINPDNFICGDERASGGGKVV